MSIKVTIRPGQFKEEVLGMMAYEFYWCDGTGKFHLVGLMPERRNNVARITQDSVINLGRSALGNALDASGLYFIQVEL